MLPVLLNSSYITSSILLPVSTRVMDLVSPIGKGQRGMIVSPPKAGKTTLLKEVAKSILRTTPDVHMLILLIDERPIVHLAAGVHQGRGQDGQAAASAHVPGRAEEPLGHMERSQKRAGMI